jgi:hypothetical protein
MWTHESRPKYNRDHLRYPSDLTDDEWAYVEPLIPLRAGRSIERCRLSADGCPSRRRGISASVLMNPYTATPGQAWQLFVGEPFNNTIAVINLVAKRR